MSNILYRGDIMLKDDNNIVKYTTVHRVMKNISNMKVSSDAVIKIQKALDTLGIAIIESAYTTAVLNDRKTIQESDIDGALEALYNYSEAWDIIFEDEQEEDF